MTPFYADYHATTPTLPEVVSAMQPFFTENFGNPASQHAWGWKAGLAVGKARAQAAKLFRAAPENFLFTSGATESIHLAVLGWLLAQESPTACQIITSEIEHKATLGACKIARRMGAEIFIAPVDAQGQVKLDAILARLKNDKKTLLSLIHGHNEIGTLNDIATIAKAVDGRAIFHVDAAQSAGKTPLHLDELPVHMLSFSGHKMYGPKGVGGLFVRDQKLIHSLFTGGGQEFNLRAGTLNVPGIVGLGCACQWASDHGAQESARLTRLRDLFFTLIGEAGDRVRINGHRAERLPNNINITLRGVDPDRLRDALEGVAFSSGSACGASSRDPNHVHRGIGLSDEDSRSTFRFGLGLQTTEEQIRFLAKTLLTLTAKGS